MKSYKKIIIGLIILPALLLGISWGCKGVPPHLLYKRGVVQYTEYGKVKGVQEDYTDPSNPNISYSALSWKGIPFAKPPVGELRWKGPQDAVCWEGIKETTQMPEPAPQLFLGGTEVTGSEDCLYLNIFRPNTDDYNLPVYVYIHGGGNTMGSAAPFLLQNFAAKTNCVAVVIQYRLGEMGFFHNSALQEGISQADDSGNYGLLDQIKALEWVQNNILFFGGDPENVTLSGESAGASNILGLMVSPLAENLFHKVVYQSGGMNELTTKAAQTQSDIYLSSIAAETEDNASISHSARLKSAEDIIGMRPQTAYFGFIVDGYVIPDSPEALISRGEYNKVPIILGGNKQEMTSALVIDSWTYLQCNQAYGMTIPNYTNLAGMVSAGVDIYTGYTGPIDNSNPWIGPYPSVDWPPVTTSDMETYTRGAETLTALRQALFVHSQARALKEQQEDIYVYEFSWNGDPGSDYQTVWGAAHANGIVFFHGGHSDDGWGTGASITPENKAGKEALERAMSTYLANFIHFGDPNGDNLPHWEEWNNIPGDTKILGLDAARMEGDSRLVISMNNHEFFTDSVQEQINALYVTDINAFNMIQITQTTNHMY